MPKMSGNGDYTMLSYNALGSAQTLFETSATNGGLRMYIPGSAGSLAGTAGASVVGFYSTGVFMPGTTAKWEPTTSPTSGGRMYVGFTDNPEIATTITNSYIAWDQDRTNTTKRDTYINRVRGLGSLISFPLWQEKEIAIPQKLRRKRFDCNQIVDFTNVDVIDRSMQTTMFWFADGLTSPATNQIIGSFVFHDRVSVEGLHSLFV